MRANCDGCGQWQGISHRCPTVAPPQLVGLPAGAGAAVSVVAVPNVVGRTYDRFKLAQVQTQPAAEVQAARVEVARFILEEYGDLEFPDHSGHSPDGFVTLADMSDSGWAANNCAAVTAEICEMIDPAQFDADSVDEITIVNMNSGGVHVGVLVEDSGGRYVVDYTARQYGDELEFPLVCTVDQWKARMTAATDSAWRFADRRLDV